MKYFTFSSRFFSVQSNNVLPIIYILGGVNYDFSQDMNFVGLEPWLINFLNV